MKFEKNLISLSKVPAGDFINPNGIKIVDNKNLTEFSTRKLALSFSNSKLSNSFNQLTGVNGPMAIHFEYRYGSVVKFYSGVIRSVNLTQHI